MEVNFDKNNEFVLVSVCVVTYNSSKYVLETLDSIKAQTYPNIELIISDDCSKDETIQVCQEWLRKNADHFVNVKLIESTKNTGIASNMNRGYMAAKGDWIKGIAGDDVLLPICIEKNVAYIQKYPNVEVLQSYNKYIDSDSKLLGDVFYEKDSVFWKDTTTASMQYQILLRKYVANTVSTFMKREAFFCVGRFDETIPMLEDYPMWIKLTKKGVKIHFMDEITTLYRVHNQSISVGGEKNAGSILLPICRYNLLVKRKYIIPNLFGIEKWIAKYSFVVTNFFMYSRFNRRTVFNGWIWWLLQFPSLLVNKIVLYKIQKTK